MFFGRSDFTRRKLLCRQGLGDALFTVADADLDAELLVDMFGEMLGGVDTAVLTTSATETEHQGGETALDITAHVGISEFIDAVEEGEDLTVVFEEADDRLVEARHLLIGLIAAWVVGTATVEHIAAAIATLILGDTLGRGETEHLDHQRPLGIILREGGRSVLRMGFVGVEICGLRAVGTFGGGFYLLELRELSKLVEDIHQVGVMEGRGTGKEFPEVLDSRRYGLDEVLLLLEVATEAVGTQHLQRAEEHEKREAVGEVAHGRHLGIILQ